MSKNRFEKEIRIIQEHCYQANLMDLSETTMINKKNDRWINKSDVTDEAFKAVAQYCLEHDEVMNFIYNGKRYRLCVVETKAESEDKA